MVHAQPAFHLLLVEAFPVLTDGAPEQPHVTLTASEDAEIGVHVDAHVSPRCDTVPVTEDEVFELAASEGNELVERHASTGLVWWWMLGPEGQWDSRGEAIEAFAAWWPRRDEIDAELVARARAHGFDLVERQWHGRPAWFVTDAERSFQPFASERRIAIDLLRERLRQVGLDPRPYGDRE